MYKKTNKKWGGIYIAIGVIAGVMMFYLTVDAPPATESSELMDEQALEVNEKVARFNPVKSLDIPSASTETNRLQPDSTLLTSTESAENSDVLEDTEFAQGFLAPDPRAPKLNRMAMPSRPTEEQLASSESYEGYLAGNRERLLSAYVAAVPDKVAQLSALIERGKQAGLPQEELAFARDKIARLQQMQQQLSLEAEELRLTYPEVDD